MLQEEPLQPLALEPLTEEEQVGLGWGSCGSGCWVSTLVRGWGWADRWWRLQFWTGVGAVWCLGPYCCPWLPPQRNFSLSVNSVAVLRLMGKGAGPPLGGTSRGRGSTRSRGRRGAGVFWGPAEVGLVVLRLWREMIWQVSHVPLVFSPGRGRGDSCFYQRSIEEGDGAFGRNPREIQRSQSWDDRCRLEGGGIEAEQREALGLGPGVACGGKGWVCQ